MKTAQNRSSLYHAVALLGGLLCCLASNHARAQTPLTGIAKIAAGNGHTCATTLSGGVKCWGSDLYGQLGINNPLLGVSRVALDVQGLGGAVSAIAPAGAHTCALTTSGGVQCWGNNDLAGQLGNNSSINERIPVDVTTPNNGTPNNG